MFCKESILWRQLAHPNVLPFLGIDGQTFRESIELAMVSPWLGFGTITEYLHSDSYNAEEHRQHLVGPNHPSG
jgi:hypothetical protein